MSNRFLWFLLLIWVPLFFFMMYLIFFVSYTWIIIIDSNVTNYEVSLFAKNYAKEFSYKCEVKKCTLTNISPLDYNITIKSSTYKDYIWEIKVSARKILPLKVLLIKDTKLNEITQPKISPSTKAKIDEIKLKKQNFWFDSIPWFGYFYFREKWNKLELFRNVDSKETKLWDFPRVPVNNIWIGEVYWENQSIFISLADDRYIYNLSNNDLLNFKLVPKINYIKLWDNYISYLINTDKWMYIYDKSQKSLEYFYMFRDFVYYIDSYIWIIYKDENSKFNNFWIESKWKNIILKYNPSTLKREVLLETDIQVTKILLDWNNIFFYDKDDKKYKLDNI